MSLFISQKSSQAGDINSNSSSIDQCYKVVSNLEIATNNIKIQIAAISQERRKTKDALINWHRSSSLDHVEAEGLESRINRRLDKLQNQYKYRCALKTLNQKIQVDAYQSTWKSRVRKIESQYIGINLDKLIINPYKKQPKILEELDQLTLQIFEKWKEHYDKNLVKSQFESDLALEIEELAKKTFSNWQQQGSLSQFEGNKKIIAITQYGRIKRKEKALQVATLRLEGQIRSTELEIEDLKQILSNLSIQKNPLPPSQISSVAEIQDRVNRALKSIRTSNLDLEKQKTRDEVEMNELLNKYHPFPNSESQKIEVNDELEITKLLEECRPFKN
ncbi:MAG: hypothetical protein K0S74_1392 [Chlamydiales bacterium]|jgi:hypothetical protein|nr:hypothetical protein [Chlamydiales bacterium]